MPLTLDQRRDRLRNRLGELEAWRLRARSPVAGWSCDGAAIALGAPWPTVDGVRRFAARAEAPADWPLAETRLCLDLGGESLVTLRFADGAQRELRARPLPHRVSAARPRVLARSRERGAGAVRPAGAGAGAGEGRVRLGRSRSRGAAAAADADRRGGGDAGRRRGGPASAGRRRGGAAGAALALAYARLRRAHRADAADADGVAAARDGAPIRRASTTPSATASRAPARRWSRGSRICRAPIRRAEKSR